MVDELLIEIETFFSKQVVSDMCESISTGEETPFWVYMIAFSAFAMEILNYVTG